MRPGRLFGEWRWTVVREWANVDGTWLCLLEWGDKDSRTAVRSGWFAFDSRWIDQAPAPPADYQPHR